MIDLGTKCLLEGTLHTIEGESHVLKLYILLRILNIGTGAQQYTCPEATQRYTGV